jgi:hypothetical protein
MRRALGLDETAAARSAPAAPQPVSPQRPARRFVRDGEVAVSLIQRDDLSGTSPLEAARQATRAQAPVGAETAVVAERNSSPRRRGRRRKVQPEAESAIVEWWKPGWRDHYR